MENRLSGVTGGGQSFSLTYDGDGRRVKKVENGVTTIFVGGHYEKNLTTNVVTKYYALGGKRVAMRNASGVTYLHGDHLGSASLTTDASGNKVSELRYRPFGEVRWASGAMATDYQFTGQRRESGLGLYDYGARFYDPLTAKRRLWRWQVRERG